MLTQGGFALNSIHAIQGVGSHAAQLLLRSGVGRLRVVDFDQVYVSRFSLHACLIVLTNLFGAVPFALHKSCCSYCSCRESISILMMLATVSVSSLICHAEAIREDVGMSKAQCLKVCHLCTLVPFCLCQAPTAPDTLTCLAAKMYIYHCMYY